MLFPVVAVHVANIWFGRTSVVGSEIASVNRTLFSTFEPDPVKLMAAPPLLVSTPPSVIFPLESSVALLDPPKLPLLLSWIARDGPAGEPPPEPPPPTPTIGPLPNCAAATPGKSSANRSARTRLIYSSSPQLSRSPSRSPE